VVQPAVPGRRHHRRLGITRIDNPAPIKAEGRIDFAATSAVIAVAELVLADEFAVERGPDLRAEGLGIECKTGLLARPERVIILAIGLLTNTGIWALALLAVFSNVTAVERMIAVWRKARHLTAEQVRQTNETTQVASQPDVRSDHHQLPEAAGTNEAREPDVRSRPTGVPPFKGGNIKREETA